jgi:hypothetical protein
VLFRLIYPARFEHNVVASANATKPSANAIFLVFTICAQFYHRQGALLKDGDPVEKLKMWPLCHNADNHHGAERLALAQPVELKEGCFLPNLLEQPSLCALPLRCGVRGLWGWRLARKHVINFIRLQQLPVDRMVLARLAVVCGNHSMRHQPCGRVSQDSIVSLCTC